MGTAKIVEGRASIVTVVIDGALDAGCLPSMKNVLDEALASGVRELVIDLETCQTIDAAGIELLLDVHRRAIHAGSAVVLRSPSPRLCRNLRLAHADKVLRVSSGEGPEARETP